MNPEARIIVMFCPQFRPIVGGAERQAEKLAVALTEVGHRVTILTPRTDPDSPATEDVNGVRIVRFPLTDLSRRVSIPGIALLNIPFMLWQIVWRMRPHLTGAQVLHCTMASLQTAGAALAGRLAGIPVLCKAAAGGDRSDLGDIEATGPSGRFVAWLARATIQKWVATTFAVEEGLKRGGIKPEKIVHIPNGVQLPDKPPLRAQNGVRHFLYLGRLFSNVNRDVPTMIAAFEDLHREFPSVELAIVGGGDLLDETRRRVEACSARDQILLPGFDEPEKWLDWAECFVLPSRKEGLSNALLEAMAAGLPCIANDIPPNREVLNGGQAGLLVPVGDRGALLNAMKRMVTDPVAAAHFRKAARLRVETAYSLDAVAQRHLSLYASMISHHHTH